MDPHDVNDYLIADRNVARATDRSIEVLVLYLEAEVRKIRLFLRNLGGRLRRFCVQSARIHFRNVTRFMLNFISRKTMPISVDVPEFNVVEAMIFNAVPLRSTWKPPKYTFNDTASVLTTDQVEDGVVHAYIIRSPAWSCLPSSILSQSKPQLIDSQLISHSLKNGLTVDDEDDRLSLPSTMLSEQDVKIQSLEAQLDFLSKQMQALLAGKIPPIAPMACNFEASSVSDDEGKGGSLGSPSETTKPMFFREEKEVPTLRSFCPPDGQRPPPPPPPLSLLLSSSDPVPQWRKLKAKPNALQMLKETSNPEHDALPLRPSVDDLRTVQLRKTNTIRSPGGTPITPRSKLSKNEGSYLANALREKFRSLQEYLSECEEDMSTSWIEEE